MLNLTEYDLLVLRAFEALRREITEAENYTVQHYNALVTQQKQQQEAAANNTTKEEEKTETV